MQPAAVEIQVGEKHKISVAAHPVAHLGGFREDWEDRLYKLRDARALETHRFQAVAASARQKNYELAQAEDELLAARLKTEHVDITYDDPGPLI